MQKSPDITDQPSGQHPRAVVLSIHDVSPRSRQTTSAMIADLAECGLQRGSLLVIPDHHSTGLGSESPGYPQWLQSVTHSGWEGVLHGYTHRRDPKHQESLTDKGITRLYTAGEGEFYDISAPEARDKLVRGRAELRACGLDPSGFIAPAWLLSAEGEAAVKEEGFAYTTRIASVNDLRSGRVTASRSLVWSTRAAWRRVCSLAWNTLLARRLVGYSLLRIGLHPPDWQHPAIRSQILKIVRSALADRTAFTYEEWVNREASSPLRS